MGTTTKKKQPLQVVQGRPAKGALSSYSSKIVKQIHRLREYYPGWGAADILYELQQKQGYAQGELPSIATVNRYFKQVGLIKPRLSVSILPELIQPPKPYHYHDRWEMDAQGPVAVDGLGYIAMINIKETKSKAHIMAFPIIVDSKYHQPKTIHYQWALRYSFIEWGLPKVIQVDKDSVFYPNATKSAFPTLFHLWLLALGVQLDFIKYPPPIKNAMVERSHQTMERQTLQGQSYQCWKNLFKFCNERRRLKNQIQTNPHSKKIPAHPNAKKNSRCYTVANEAQIINIKRVYQYLAKCRWYRTVSKYKTFSLGGQAYYLKKAIPQAQISIRFCNRAKKLICQDANEQIIQKVSLKNFSSEKLMGNTAEGLIKMKRKIDFYRNCPI